jgi:Tol biopolymer transport system component
MEVRRYDLRTGAVTTVADRAALPAPSPVGPVVFVAEDPRIGPALRVLDPTTGAVRDLVPAGRFTNLMVPRVAPDGGTVVFAAPAAEGRAASAPVPGRATEAVWELWSVPVAGGEVRQVSRIGERLPTAAWSRDGTRLLVQGDLGRYLLDVGTGTAEPVAPDGGRGGLDWSGD